MINTENLEELITYVLHSSYLKDEKPVSLIILAKPESGKTSCMNKFIINNGICSVSDITYSGLIDLLPRFEKKEIRTLLIPDMLKVFGRRMDFSSNFVTLLNEFVEEGIQSVYTYKNILKFSNPVRGNFIAAITSTDFFNNIGYWGKIGFVTRVIPFSYDYNTETVTEIFKYIIGGKYNEEKYLKLKFPSKEKKVELPPEMAKELLPVSVKIATEAKIFGFRLQKNLQILAKACALANKKDTVDIEDIKKVIHLSNWINLKFNTL